MNFPFPLPLRATETDRFRSPGVQRLRGQRRDAPVKRNMERGSVELSMRSSSKSKSRVRTCSRLRSRPSISVISPFLMRRESWLAKILCKRVPFAQVPAANFQADRLVVGMVQRGERNRDLVGGEKRVARLAERRITPTSNDGSNWHSCPNAAGGGTGPAADPPHETDVQKTNENDASHG